ncbi:glycosyltransferase family 61 protein [Acidisoma cellulosilytica]|uniref:Glycosyltransferase family 61 protein n=1 Tax=Acidisoma cellulosilyticum TaxID=2802395 RepID=A0A964E2B2_9PROT|nr:glycosyltransferase 61 family protein [Acidisoma cellulosilyticum]MCB8878658.1 glycosyltransferase family 61 protein [Acidisoma cellulosilyticum]
MPTLAETSIATVAARIGIIEQSVPWNASVSSILGRGFERPDYASLFHQRKVTATVRRYRLEGVHLDTAAMTLIKDGKKIQESNYLVPAEYYENACVIEDGIVRLDTGIHYTLARAFDNYYHWLIQTIPGLDWTLRNLPGAEVTLLSGDLNRWQLEILTLLGYDRLPRITLNPSQHYAIPILEFNEFQNGSTAFSVSRSAQDTFRRLALAALDSAPAQADIIYVARTDSKNRAAENEAEVMKLLEAEGVQIVIPGQMSVAQQINLFHKADAVIGPHGAGMTNIVFCRPGTIFYEFMPAHYLNPCFTRLAEAAQLHYLVDLFDSSADASGDVHARGFVLDPALILARLRDIRRHLASRPARAVAAGQPSSH